jgi:hypothetical protein
MCGCGRKTVPLGRERLRTAASGSRQETAARRHEVVGNPAGVDNERRRRVPGDTKRFSNKVNQS